MKLLKNLWHFLEKNIPLWWFSFWSVPMLFYCRPYVLELDNEKIRIRIKLRRKTKNHYNSMYFGALIVGADCSAGYLTMFIAKKEKISIGLLFKDCHTEFLKRANGDVVFECHAGKKIAAAIEEAKKNGQRINIPVEIIATVPQIDPQTPVAKFLVTVSLKVNAANSSVNH